MYKAEIIIIKGIVILLTGFILDHAGYTVPFWLLGLIYLGVIGASYDS